MEVVKLLLAARADVNQKNADEATALHAAVRRDSLPLVDVLMEHGAEVNLAGQYGATPLYCAAAHNFTEIMERLLEAKAHVDTQSIDVRRVCPPLIRTG